MRLELQGGIVRVTLSERNLRRIAASADLSQMTSSPVVASFI